MRDRLDPLAANRLLDLLGHRGDLAEGDNLPPLSHWLHFAGVEPYGERGADGHPLRGDFLPALPHLPRRMWAGSRVTFHRPLVGGKEAERTTTIVNLVEKDGRSGPLAFATLHHEVKVDGEVAVMDEQTLVFREAADGPAVRPEGTAPAVPGEWHREVRPDATMLFRYSALTWNSHRIHYDADYAREAEGYPDLVIHGPLTATLLLDLARRETEREIAAFEFQAKAPLFLGDTISLDGSPAGALIASREGVPSIVAKVEFA